MISEHLGKGHNMAISFKVENSAVFYFLHLDQLVVGLGVNLHLLQKETSVM